MAGWLQCRTAGCSAERFGQVFAETYCRSLRGVTFSMRRKSPKTRTGRGCFDSPSPCEPSPATTEVGLRSPFWNPLRLVQCLTLPTDFFAKNKLCTKNDAGLLKLCHPLEGIKGEPRTVPLWRFKGGVSKGAGKTQSPPLCDSLHTFCSHRKYARGATGSETLLKAYQKHPSLAVGHGLCEYKQLSLCNIFYKARIL